jgi:hypothetical protein
MQLQMENELVASVQAFLRNAADSGIDFFNEAELQHELGYWLRSKVETGLMVYFERPAKSFFPTMGGKVRKEIDLVIAPADRSWHFAIELKCPRNGRIPETMFDACKDLKRLEDLVSTGFRGGLLIMHVNDPGFYESGLKTGIYSFFRDGAQLTGTIKKPTGKKDLEVYISGSYRVMWESYGEAGRYWLQMVTNKWCHSPQPTPG